MDNTKSAKIFILERQNISLQLVLIVRFLISLTEWGWNNIEILI